MYIFNAKNIQLKIKINKILLCCIYLYIVDFMYLILYEIKNIYKK